MAASPDRSPFATAQDRLLAVFGNDPPGRAALFAATLRRDANESASYWLQLVVSVGIATLGLILGSSAVVIGAMLVAPLMGPIVSLALGLGAGSPFLVLRSAGRIALSVAAAVGGAALLTRVVPIHELNPEIAARTSPTVLDLATASFCALAGVYATLRTGSDTATTAAGTSIGISLVPPLCASGFGLGTGSWGVASGASLLFLTNLVAIVAVGTVMFVAVGANRVDVAALEREELSRQGHQAFLSRAAARRLARFFESRWGWVFRMLMPLVLLAAVYVPLRRALDEVAWEISVRSAVTNAMAEESRRIVESRVRIERHGVDVALVILGNTDDARATRKRIEASVAAASEVTPHVDVLAVPDAAAFAGLESTLARREAEVRQPEPPSPPEALDTVRAHVLASVESVWPGDSAGRALQVEASVDGPGALVLRVTHLGAPLERTALEALRRSLGATLQRDVELVDAAVPAETLTRGDGDASFVARVAAGATASAGIRAITACVERPAGDARRRADAKDAELARTIDATLALHPRVSWATGSQWRVRFVASEACPASLEEGAEDAGKRPKR
jgi:uncharacterized hydrophobic protein (TIGR00271 family)